MLKTYFEPNKAQFDQPEQVKASHILVATKEEADAIVKQLERRRGFRGAGERKVDGSGQQRSRRRPWFLWQRRDGSGI